MKKLFSTLLCLLLALSLASCLKPAPTLEELKLQEEAERAQRINEQYPFSFDASAVKTYRYEDNHRLYGLDGDWVYYSSGKSDDDKNWICRSRLDGSDKTWIASLEYPRDAQWFSVHDEWIFFLEFATPKSKRGRIFRMKRDGTQKTPMEEIYANSLYWQDGWLYYTRYGAVGRMRPDGSAHEIILEMDGIYQSFLAEDWLYISVARGDDGYVILAPLDLYRVHISGSPVIQLDNEELDPTEIQVSGEWVYFRNRLKDDKLYRVSIEERTIENLFEKHSFTFSDGNSFAIIGDWIVFTQQKKYHYPLVVYRMLTNGNFMQMITNSLPDPLKMSTSPTLLSKGYLSMMESISADKDDIGKTQLTLYKFDNKGQLHNIISIEADYYIDPLAFYENGLIYQFSSKGDSGIRWISLEQD